MSLRAGMVGAHNIKTRRCPFAGVRAKVIRIPRGIE
jgi:hypothetical protein